MFSINHWAYPEAFWLFLVIPIFIGAYLHLFQSNRLRVNSSYASDHFSEASSSQVFRSFLPHIFYLLALSASIMGLARPQFVSRWESKEGMGWDVLCLVDVSKSMVEVEGRLSHIRTYLQFFVDQQEENRMGIILFGEEAFTFVPLTWDKQVLKEMIDRIQAGWVPDEGTSIGNAIALALHRFEASKATAPYILLFSDGGNNRSLIAPLSAARLAASKQVPLSAFIWKPHPDSLLQVERVAQDVDTWNEITAANGGRTHFLPHLEPISNKMFTLPSKGLGEGTERGYRRVEDRYPSFLLVAIILLLVSWGIRSSSWANPLEM